MRHTHTIHTAYTLQGEQIEAQRGEVPDLVNDNTASLVAQSVKSLPAMQETKVRFLGQKDPLEKEMATHSSIPAWRIPWTEETGRLQSMGSQESDTS